MNKKGVLGVLAGILIVIGGFFVLYPQKSVAPVSQPAVTASTTSEAPPAQQPVKTGSQPSFNFGTGTTVQIFGRFDTKSLVATSSYPVISGTANVPTVGIVVYNSKGVGIVATSDISVIEGRWTYSCSVALSPGTYKLALRIGDVPVAIETLTVKAQ